MLEGYNISLDMEKSYRLIDQDVHFAQTIPLDVKMRISSMMEGILFEDDPVVGTVREQHQMAEPLICYILLDVLSDADLTKYNESENRISGLYDDLDKDHDNLPYNLVSKLWLIYSDTKNEVLRVSEAKYSTSSTVRNMLKTLGGDGVRDIGLIRRMFTEFMMEMRKQAYSEEKERVENEVGGTKGKIVDMSKYKPKNNK